MLPEPWHHVRRLLVIRLDNIGDIVMIGPALRALRQALPAARITLMASPAGSQVAPLLPWVDDVLVHRALWQDASGSMGLDPAAEQDLVAGLRARAFDAAVIFTSFSQSPYPPAYVCYLAGIPIRLGQSKEFGGSVLSQWVKPRPDGVHQVDRNLHLLEQAGFALAGRQLEVRIPAAAQDATARKLAALGLAPDAPFILLAPGASCPARRYDVQRFAEVARTLAGATAWPVLVVGSARETDFIAPILAAGPPGRILSLAGQTSVPELAAVIARSRLVLANDSGPMHLADATGRPMIILYSGTELEEQWRPRGAPARLLRRPTACSPCYRFDCPYHMECLDIAPSEVVTAALDLLAQTGATQPMVPAC